MKIEGGGAILHGLREGTIFEVGEDARLRLDDVVVSNSGDSAISNLGDLKVFDSTFEANRAPKGSGGAILNEGGTVRVENSTFRGNSATDGGAIANEDEDANGQPRRTGELTVMNATFIGNRATSGLGGAIFNGGSADVSNSLFLDNDAFLGHAVANYPGARSFVFHHNAIEEGVDGWACFDTDGDPIAGDRNLVEGAETRCAGAAHVQGVTEMEYREDAAAGAAAESGGLTRTPMLATGNPAIDAGDNRHCPKLDQREFPRGDAPANPCDIGAYEANRVAIADALANEGGEGCRRVDLAVTLDVASSDEVTVKYDVPPSDEACNPDTLRRRTSEELVFSSGETSKTVAVGIRAERGFSPTRRLSVTITQAENAAVAPGSGKASALLVNDDANTTPTARDYVTTIGAGTSTLTIDLAELAGDAETPDAGLTFALVEPAPAQGTVSLSGSIATFAVPSGAVGADAFGYRVTDRGDRGCGRPPCEPARSATGLVTVRTATPAPPSPDRASPEPTAAPPPSPRVDPLQMISPEPGPDDVTPAPPEPGHGPDLALTQVALELVPDGTAHALAGMPLAAATQDSLRLTATVVNQGDAASTPTYVAVTTPGWDGAQVPLPEVAGDSSLDIDESLAAPSGMTEDTRFVVTIGTVEGESDASDNVAVVVVAAVPESPSSPGINVLVVLIALGVVAAGAVVAIHLLRKPPTPRAHDVSRPERAEGAVTTGGLGELADRYLGHDPGPPLWAAGPACERLRGSFAHEDLAHAFLATLYWRTVITTRRFEDVLRAATRDPRETAGPDLLVVSHAGATRLDLVVLDPAFSGSEPAADEVTAAPDDLRSALTALTKQGNLRLRRPRGLLADALSEIARAVRFGVVIAPRPEIALTNSPSPAWPVATEGEEISSTAGVVVVDARGRRGVTVAEHAVRGNENVVVNGHAGKIVSSDPISDSSFVEVDVDPLPDARGSRGPLSGMTPRQMEVVSFDGARSGSVTTRVVAWDPTILTMESYIQNKIVTEPVTLPGDSGAALVDGDDHVLGFAFYTTGLNAHPAHSGWIWADSVYRAHGLRPAEPV